MTPYVYVVMEHSNDNEKQHLFAVFSSKEGANNFVSITQSAPEFRLVITEMPLDIVP